MNCTQLLKTPAQQKIFDKNWRKYMRQSIKVFGGLEKNAFTKFRDEYKRGFIVGCRKIKTKKTKKIK